MARIKMVLITEQVVMDNSATQTNVATQQPPVNSVQPMDPAKKNKLILGISLGVGGVVVVVIGIIVFMMLSRANYGESYKILKELKPKVSALASNYDCTKVVDYVNSTYTSDSSYNEYVEGCRASADGISDLVAQLEHSSGVAHDKDVQAQFARFKEAIDSVMPDETELNQRLSLYETWHKFLVAANGINASKSSDAEIQNVAKILTNSGNDLLAKYGAGWLEKTLAYVQAYRAYNNASYSSSDYASLRQARNDRQSEQKTWVAENKPDITEIGGLEFKNNSRMGTEFNKLYEMVVELYEENYDDSGECTEFLGEVFCS